MTDLSDEARRLLRSGRTSLAPTRHELEATQVALAVKLAAAAAPALGAVNSFGLGPSAGVSGSLIKLALVTVAAAGLGVGYYALRSRPAAVQPTAAVVAAATQPSATRPTPVEITPPAQALPAAVTEPIPAPKPPTRGRASARARTKPAAAVGSSAHEPAALAPAEPGPAEPAPQAPEPKPNTLALEIELIQAARGQLQRGQAELALRNLDTYVTRFPSGLLRSEQQALRALALCKLGRVPAARTIIRHIRVVQPGSPYLIRLERACGATDR